MRVRGVRLTNVRSRRELQVEIGAGLTILVGPNGAGKTTVLEAMTLALEGRLLRAGNVRDLIRSDEGLLRIEVALEEEAVASTAVLAYSREGERRLSADGAPLEDFSRWREALPVRTFVPDDLRLIKGSPRRRREYLDGLAGGCELDYRRNLGQYEEALEQRNVLLRILRGDGYDAQFAPWETILVQAGLAVSGARSRALATFVGSFQHMHAELTAEAPETLRLVYRSNVAGLDEIGYRERLAAMRGADRQRTYTHLGPHRDDLRLLRSGLDMRECASQGEQRAALLTLVLAEWEYECGRPQKPLLLLDDVMSELDEERRRALVAVLQRGGQVVITTTDLRYFTTEELQGAAVVPLDGRGGMEAA
jgi:DNA replication and repair protein RecF